MAKALKIAGAVVLGAGLVLATGGLAAGFSVTAVLGAASGLTIGAVGVSIGALIAAGGLLTTLGGALSAPKVPAAQVDRLTASIDPRTPRKSVFGSTALPVEIRYEEWFGPDQEYCGWIVAHASHRIDGVDEIWLNDELAWTLAGGVAAKFVGYFLVQAIVLEGSPDNTVVISTPDAGKWGTSHRLTGCAYSHIQFRVTGVSKKAESPFASGIPSRITIIGRGMPFYDPRRDSTVPGGEGPMRIDDQSTWRFTADDGTVIGENLPLAILNRLIGWRIRNPETGALRLATGGGLPAKRLDLASFQYAANLADERANRSSGGTEPRYHGAGVISEGEDPKVVYDALCAACMGRFRDVGGKLALAIAHNDLAEAALDEGLNADDVIGGFVWNPDPALDATPTVVRGKYVDATPASLYQLIDYPEVAIESPDGIERPLPFDLGYVESPSQAQRIVKQVLQRKQLQRSFSAPFDIRAWGWPVGKVVPFTFPPLGFQRKLFRVAEQEIGQGGSCQMTLTEESAAIYAWDADDAPAVMAIGAIGYDPTRAALIQAIAEIATSSDAALEEIAAVSSTVQQQATTIQEIGDRVSSIENPQP